MNLKPNKLQHPIISHLYFSMISCLTFSWEVHRDLMKSKMNVYDIIMAYIILYSILYALNMNMSRKANVT